MKTILIGINAKYIHTNLALRYLYTYTNNSFDVEFVEFTIKNEIDYIITQILSFKPDLIGFSCYIWNIEIISAIITQLKTKTKAKILLGGPEVYDVKHWFNDLPVDFIITGEGEYPFKQLLYALLENKSLNNIPQLHFCDNNKVHTNENTYFIDLNTLPSPYRLEVDLPELKHRIQYIESSRGCPYHCSYCLASLEKNVRYFANIKSEISYLMKNGGKIFKFLDRTFNLRKDFALDMFTFIIDNHLPGCVFQFEITGDILHRDIIEYLNSNAPQNLFRFEIGIQSTNITTNIAVDRIQDNQKLFDNIKLIQDGGVIDLHLDLIAGLPYEDLSSFEKTFNDVISLRPKELQLGFLKLLKGTKLRNDASLYGYKFNATAPYEIIENDFLTKADLDDIKTVEQVLEKYYNSMFMPVTINKILDNITSPFSFFLDFGKYYQANFSWYNYNLDDLFTRLFNYLKVIKHPSLDDYLFIMKYDYLNHFKIKPKIWWQRPIKQKRSEMINYIFSHNLSSYSLEDLYRYSLIEKYNNSYLIAIYKGNNTEIKIITINQKKFN